MNIVNYVNGKCIMNRNEKLALETTGMEGYGKTFVVNDKTATELIAMENSEKINNSIQQVVDKFDRHNQAIEDYAKAISEDINGLEIMPMKQYALIKPFDKNPFQQIKVEGGIITDLGGQTPTYKSHESGEIEEETQFIKVGTVIEVGYECEYLKPGDVVFYSLASEVMIPFFRQGFVAVAENRIMAVVNSDLTTRNEQLQRKRECYGG